MKLLGSEVKQTIGYVTNYGYRAIGLREIKGYYFVALIDEGDVTYRPYSTLEKALKEYDKQYDLLYLMFLEYEDTEVEDDD